MDLTKLALPGDIPGLLRRGSPCTRAPHDEYCRVVVWGLPEIGSHIVLRTQAKDQHFDLVGDAPGRAHGSELRLDLTDATGRTHAAWWLAAKGGVESHRDLGFWSFHWAMPYRARSDKRRYRMLTIGRLRCWSDTGAEGTTAVPALADLDPKDPRTLPDGSRWVDAEALRRVCLHVAGREVTL